MIKKILGALGFSIVALATIYVLNSQSNKSLDPRVQFLSTQKNIDGFELPLKLFENEYLVINFWATWCPPCIEETPSLVSFIEKHSNFSLIAVSQDSAIRDIQNFTKLFPKIKNENIVVVADLSQEISRQFKVDKLPETFVYKKSSGKFLQISGSTNWLDDKIYQEIQKQL